MRLVAAVGAAGRVPEKGLLAGGAWTHLGQRHMQREVSSLQLADHTLPAHRADANLKNPKDYWDYENFTPEWGYVEVWFCGCVVCVWSKRQWRRGLNYS